MHRKQTTAQVVYQHLYPTPSPTDPQNFAQHLSKNLVGEVRIETATFYGSLDTIEARYPGLNYSYGPHRRRLGRFPHHARLFKAFDDLGLTEHEIAQLCRWEGTLWARERYERDEGVKVRDTTGQDIGPWVDRRKEQRKQKAINVKTDIEVEIAPVRPNTQPQRQEEEQDEVMEDDDRRQDDEDDMDEEQDDGEDSDDEFASVAPELHQRLVQAAALRDNGVNVSIDPEWEQYMKEQRELQEQLQQQAQLQESALQQLEAELHASTSRAQAQQHSNPPQVQQQSPSRSLQQTHHAQAELFQSTRSIMTNLLMNNQPVREQQQPNTPADVR
jgi:hypothetical protein